MTIKMEAQPLSESVKKIMFRVMKNSGAVVQGFIFFRYRFVLKAYLDEPECDALLESMVINKVNVLRYLRRKYIPTWRKDGKGAIFKDQKCIQSAIVKEDGTLLIRILKSEPHKIITDTFHVCHLLDEQGIKYNKEIKFVIEQVQIAYQDTLLYNTLIREFGLRPPAASIMYEKQLLFKYRNLENVAKIKKRSVKRKFARYLVKIGQIDWKQLRKIIAITDFRPSYIRGFCKEMREESAARGIKVVF